MRFAIIGAGWYGCHLATALTSLGIDVKVFEQNAHPLKEASGNNQFRLHQGFHYARHHSTRMQSRDGFMRFVERYPHLSSPVAQNIYAVPKFNSLIDFSTYRLIMTATGVEFSEIDHSPVPLENIAGMLQTQERVIMLSRSRDHFQKRLTDKLNLNCRIERVEDHGTHVEVDGAHFDYVIDATWGHLTRPNVMVFYEPTVLLYYEGLADHPAITLVDGPLVSVYPTEDPTVYTLSSVVHTPLGTFQHAAEARACLAAITSDVIAAKVEAMEEQVSHYLPQFRDTFRFIGPQLAIKTKPVGAHDDRSCSVTRHGRIFSVMSGKIDTIFTATERVLSLLEMSVGETDLAQPTLRSDIREYAR